MTEKKSPYFEMTLHYYDPAKGTDPSYTGNITEWDWTNKDPSAPGSGTANTYAFTYDKLSRLTNTVQYEGAGTTPVDNFVEQGLSYDKNGNFLTLQRYAAGSLVDDIGSATYNGNQIAAISNNGTACTYAYDANGNCTTDGLNSLKLEYNFLNLTSAARDASDNLQAAYRWLADGTKLGVVDTDGMGYDYVGSLIYKRDASGDLILESTGFGGGRIEVSESSGGNIYTPNYFLTDHLGSTRVVAKPGENGLVIAERSDYYAFGGRHENPDLEASYNRFHFSGKEDQTTGDLPYQDFGARFFGKKLPVWTGPDPLARNNPRISPYAYCSNNPINAIDPNGKWDIKVHVYNDRAMHGYGIAVVSDRNGNEVMRFDVRAEGVKGHDRHVTGADTPLGVYDIPATGTWIESTDEKRASMGPNARLVINPEAGEVVETGRNLFRFHGGRQEAYDSKTDTWSAVSNPSLEKTEGCLRASDEDMAALNETTTNLQATDSAESPGRTTIVDDLQKRTVPASKTNMIEVKTVYEIPQPSFTPYGSN